jgi:hypothetical protein
MSGDDPLADWRNNPFFVLGINVDASQAEVERAGQRLLGLLAVGSVGVERYATPLGPATRDADKVRQALAALRDPNERVLHELWADISKQADTAHGREPTEGWEAANAAVGWTETCTD